MTIIVAALLICVVIAGLLFFTCTNYKECGAMVSFDNKLCNKNPQLARDRFNQRKG